METFDGYTKRVMTNNNKLDSENVRKIRIAIQAAASADLLTNDKDWDPYLRYIQHAIDIISDMISKREEQLHNPHVVNHEAILLIKLALADLNGQKLALLWAIELPKQIKETGEIAKDLYDTPEE